MQSVNGGHLGEPRIMQLLQVPKMNVRINERSHLLSPFLIVLGIYM